MTVTIRALLPEEASCLSAIERDAAERFREVGLAAIADDVPTPEPFIRAVVNKGVAFGAATERDGLVGFVLAGLLDDALHIYELSVASASGRRGIGSRLLAEIDMAALARGLGAVTLSTFVDVPWNAPFYARRGFKPVEIEDWGPAFHLLNGAEHAAGLPLDRRVFMRKELAR
ncbi:GNAT family N-acetyltransferase [Mesorhizobium sp. BR1-1-16]|uniref:GNAT family N-acetyltransferase n=1 Tax=Mesorhizobium sp. BR1-1-16 TaxID=2876653 RepID=UPI001CCE7991|nr:GNAT family N-acetyltransferase [Mesorhizobium sp. BR1-1-16]MBZ9935784.1 GNAT family N-acetyltransferase [Mesorhizobium sp. BR1-1-16]